MSTQTKGFEQVVEAMNQSTGFFSLKDGESTIIRIISSPGDVVGVKEHTMQIGSEYRNFTCTGAGCPCCEAGDKPSKKTYFVILDKGKDGTESSIKVLKASKKMLTTIQAMYNEYGALDACDFKVIRTGQKFETTYQFIPKAPAPYTVPADAEIPDLMELTAPKTREAIVEVLNPAQATSGNSQESAQTNDPFSNSRY